jgi:hypothetical protein
MSQPENVNDPSHPRSNPCLTFEDRTKRVKDARSEAQKEIEDYKKEKEAEYQKFEKEVRISPMHAVSRRAGGTNDLTAQLRQQEGRG